MSKTGHKVSLIASNEIQEERNIKYRIFSYTVLVENRLGNVDKFNLSINSSETAVPFLHPIVTRIVASLKIRFRE